MYRIPCHVHTSEKNDCSSHDNLKHLQNSIDRGDRRRLVKYVHRNMNEYVIVCVSGYVSALISYHDALDHLDWFDATLHHVKILQSVFVAYHFNWDKNILVEFVDLISQRFRALTANDSKLHKCWSVAMFPPQVRYPTTLPVSICARTF